jgi:aminoglycoside 6'-N-acetyltransferase I
VNEAGHETRSGADLAERFAILIIRRANEADWPLWAALLAKLHPDQGAAEFEDELAILTALPDPYVGFLAFAPDGKPAGMIDARVRNYVEGAPDLRAAYIEDLWVEPEYRRSGVAKSLLNAVELWARNEGMIWLGSDTPPDNLQSQEWHLAAGFNVVERLVVFGKRLA